MIILFLDVDGVLLDPRVNTINSLKNQISSFSPSAIAYLDLLISSIETTGQSIAIVISSSRRIELSTEELMELFGQYLFSKKIIDKLPDQVKIVDRHIGFEKQLDRGGEIAVWLELNKQKFDITNFIILDDNDASMTRLFASNFVHCQNNIFGKQEFDKAKLMYDTHKIKPAGSDNEQLTNFVSLELIHNKKQDKNPVLVELNLTVSLDVRRQYVKLVTTHFLKLSNEKHDVAKLVAEYDDPRQSQIELFQQLTQLKIPPKVTQKEDVAKVSCCIIG